MRDDCTALILRYRDISRLVWNLGFWAHPEMREWVCERSYATAMARLFEGMVLRPLGCDAVIGDTLTAGDYVHIAVELDTAEAELLVDEDLNPGHRWGRPTIRAKRDDVDMRFVELFDWYSLGPRDSHMVIVKMERCDSHPELTGRRALVELMNCKLFLVQPD